jgi:hypothetical protein
MNKKQLKKLKKTNNKTVKKGAGFGFLTSYNSAKNMTSKAYKSIGNTTNKLVKSGVDVLNSKYLFSLIVNPSSVHRMLFKNSHFITFIDFPQIQRLYCKGQQPNCVVLKDGYLYSNNPVVVNSANNPEEIRRNNEETLIESGSMKSQQDANISNEEAKKMNSAILSMEEEIDKLDESYDNKANKYGLMSQTINRLAFAKLNDALLTDNMAKVTPGNPLYDPDYISFKPGYQPLFEFFTTYKYQVNRTLHYGGWKEWMYITEEMRKLFVLNPQLETEFLNIIWLTSGIFKVIALVLGKGSKTKDQVIQAVKSGNEDIISNQINNKESLSADKKSQEIENEDNMEVQQQSRFGKFTSSVKKGFYATGRMVSNTLGTNISKWRVIRCLLKYYDIDPDKYNFNLMKRTGILKKNYPLFMDREAKKAVQIAINNLRNNRNSRLSNVNLMLADKSYMNKTLDQLLNELMMYNVDMPNMNNRYGGKNKHGGKKTRKNGVTHGKRINKMYGGNLLFFNNIKFIFNNTYKLMIRDQMKSFTNLMSSNPEGTHLIAELYAEIVRCLSMMTITLCLTIGNFLIGKTGLPISMPACYISNAMYMMFIFKMRILDLNKVNMIEKITSTENQPVQTTAIPVTNAIPVNPQFASQLPQARSTQPIKTTQGTIPQAFPYNTINPNQNNPNQNNPNQNNPKNNNWFLKFF